mgnify:CR=1 FL=1
MPGLPAISNEAVKVLKQICEQKMHDVSVIGASCTRLRGREKLSKEDAIFADAVINELHLLKCENGRDRLLQGVHDDIKPSVKPLVKKTKRKKTKTVKLAKKVPVKTEAAPEIKEKKKPASSTAKKTKKVDEPKKKTASVPVKKTIVKKKAAPAKKKDKKEKKPKKMSKEEEIDEEVRQARELMFDPDMHI